MGATKKTLCRALGYTVSPAATIVLFNLIEPVQYPTLREEELQNGMIGYCDYLSPENSMVYASGISPWAEFGARCQRL